MSVSEHLSELFSRGGSAGCGQRWEIGGECKYQRDFRASASCALRTQRWGGGGARAGVTVRMSYEAGDGSAQLPNKSPHVSGGEYQHEFLMSGSKWPKVCGHPCAQRRVDFCIFKCPISTIISASHLIKLTSNHCDVLFADSQAFSCYYINIVLFSF